MQQTESGPLFHAEKSTVREISSEQCGGEVYVLYMPSPAELNHCFHFVQSVAELASNEFTFRDEVTYMPTSSNN